MKNPFVILLTILLLGSIFLSSYSSALHAPSEYPVLLIENKLPWDSTANQDLLKKVGVEYHKVESNKLQAIDLDTYSIVIIANDQDTDFYEDLIENSTKIEDYIKQGGSMLYGAADKNNIFKGSLPGGVQTVPTLNKYNVIANDSHPIVTAEASDSKPLIERNLFGINISHRTFIEKTLPVGHEVIFRSTRTNEPTLVYYPLGEGHVIASGITWESGYKNYFLYASKAYDDVLLYLMSLAQATKEISVPLPQTAITINGEAQENNWYTSPVTIQLTPASDSVTKTEYRLNNSNWQVYNSPIELVEDSIYNLEYRSLDQAGNIEQTKNKMIKIDQTPPTVKLTNIKNEYYVGDSLMIGQITSDTLSGIANSDTSINRNPITDQEITLTQSGKYTVRASAIDFAGNQTVQENTFIVYDQLVYKVRPAKLNRMNKKGSFTIHVAFPKEVNPKHLNLEDFVINEKHHPDKIMIKEGSNDLILKVSRSSIDSEKTLTLTINPLYLKGSSPLRIK